MRTFNVRDFGAIGKVRVEREVFCASREHAGWRTGHDLWSQVYRADGAAEDSEAFRRAIDAASGGGKVVVPPGDYAIAPLTLSDGVELVIEEGATLYGPSRCDDYETAAAGRNFPAQPPGLGLHAGAGIDGWLLGARHANDVSITGQGTIHAQGGAFFIPWWAAEKSYELRRPWRCVHFIDCQNVRVEGVTIQDSFAWTLVFERCRDIVCDGVTIRNLHGPNTDGIDIVDSVGVTVRNCDIHTTDDGICLKSESIDGEVSDVLVEHCRVRSLCNGLKLGTETLGEIRRVHFRDCTVYNPENDLMPSQAAIHVSCFDGGLIEDVAFERIHADGVGCGLAIHNGCRTLKQNAFRQPRPGVIREIDVNEFRGTGLGAPSFVSGLARQPLERITLQECVFEGVPTEASSVNAADVPEIEDAYPSCRLYGPLPDAAILSRHVNHFQMTRLSAKNYSRPVIDHKTEKSTTSTANTCSSALVESGF